MPLARPLVRWLFVVCSCVLLLLAGCDQHHSAAAPARVSTIVPPDGATGVTPDVVITLTLESPMSVLRPEDVIVQDGGNRLPGTLRRAGDTASWTWTPTLELPRGCRITVATAQQGAVAAFTVRDFAAATTVLLPFEAVDAAFCWSGGRRAVHTANGRVFEVIADAAVERFVDLPPGARTCGDGAFVAEVLDAGVRYCVRCDLEGNVDRVPTPFGAPLGDNNDAGDVVVFVPSTLAAPSQQGLWRLSRSALAFELAGSLSLANTTDQPSIEADGTVSLAYEVPGGLRVSRFAIGDPAGEHHDLTTEGRNPQFAAGDDGRGVLAFWIYEPPTQPGFFGRAIVRAARFVPGVGLDLLPAELRSWRTGELPPPEIHLFSRIDALHVGKLGSACIVFASGSVGGGFPLPTTNTYYDAVRIEPDDRVVAAQSVLFALSVPGLTNTGALGVSPWRAELWSLDTMFHPDTIGLLRERPDAEVIATIYEAPEGSPFTGWSFAFDDSGRALVAVVERAPGGALSGSRVVVFE
jgi:hypothetical protein